MSSFGDTTHNPPTTRSTFSQLARYFGTQLTRYLYATCEKNFSLASLSLTSPPFCPSPYPTSTRPVWFR